MANLTDICILQPLLSYLDDNCLLKLMILNKQLNQYINNPIIWENLNINYNVKEIVNSVDFFKIFYITDNKEFSKKKLTIKNYNKSYYIYKLIKYLNTSRYLNVYYLNYSAGKKYIKLLIKICNELNNQRFINYFTKFYSINFNTYDFCNYFKTIYNVNVTEKSFNNNLKNIFIEVNPNKINNVFYVTNFTDNDLTLNNIKPIMFKIEVINNLKKISDKIKISMFNNFNKNTNKFNGTFIVDTNKLTDELLNEMCLILNININLFIKIFEILLYDLNNKLMYFK